MNRPDDEQTSGQAVDGSPDGDTMTSISFDLEVLHATVGSRRIDEIRAEIGDIVKRLSALHDDDSDQMQLRRRITNALAFIDLTKTVVQPIPLWIETVRSHLLADAASLRIPVPSLLPEMPLGMKWSHEPEHYVLRRADGSPAAQVWTNDSWHTFDVDGIGGYNGRGGDGIDVAIADAGAAVLEQGWGTPSDGEIWTEDEVASYEADVRADERANVANRIRLMAPPRDGSDVDVNLMLRMALTPAGLRSWAIIARKTAHVIAEKVVADDVGRIADDDEPPVVAREGYAERLQCPECGNRCSAMPPLPPSSEYPYPWWEEGKTGTCGCGAQLVVATDDGVAWLMLDDDAEPPEPTHVVDETTMVTSVSDAIVASVSSVPIVRTIVDAIMGVGINVGMHVREHEGKLAPIVVGDEETP